MSIAVFLTCNMPEKTLDRFFDVGQDYMKEVNLHVRTEDPLTASDLIMIVTSKDPNLYPKRSPQPFQPFHSPFAGESPEQVATWFRKVSDLNSTFPMALTFIILDEQTAKDNRTCLLVSLPAHFVYQPIQSMRCDFSIVFHECDICEDGLQPSDSDYAGDFMRSRLVLTKKNKKSMEMWSFLPVINGVFVDDGKKGYGEDGEEHIQEY
ncbi:hypothetical protein CPB83DRAFT_857172 [Crepidotus variabilis]|uniref:Uncharacterized protein n=1 Tax=Crepidotus variabilis TaxID=179855 RepID=A0A9P6EDG9_9AGAR|nr:hypothetical protein CPB83DRAFT_857172 [Crepidotus variabilis]